MKTLRPEKGSPLEAAIALLIHNEAEFLATERETRRELAQFSREIMKIERETYDRFKRIEEVLEAHGRLLERHSQLLEALPDAIQERIGFKLKK